MCVVSGYIIPVLDRTASLIVGLQGILPQPKNDIVYAVASTNSTPSFSGSSITLQVIKHSDGNSRVTLLGGSSASKHVCNFCYPTE